MLLVSVLPDTSYTAKYNCKVQSCHRTQLLCAGPEEILPRRLYFNDAALFFITADSSALTEGYHGYLTQTAWQSLFKSQAIALEIIILPVPTDQPPELSTLIDF